jgi:hypothetical protein
MEKEDILLILKIIFIFSIISLSISVYFIGYEIGNNIWSINIDY